MTSASENRLFLPTATAADLMISGPPSLSEKATFREAVSHFIDRNVAVALVSDEGNKPIGVISVTDLLIHVRECLSKDRIESVAISTLMTPTIFSVPANMPAAKVIEDLLRSRVHHLFVEDKGKLVGVINSCDIIQYLRSGE